MAFPDKKTLNKIRKELEKAEGTLMPPENPTPLQKFRWDLWQKFVKFKLDHDYTLEDMGKLIGVDKSKMSKILRHRIEDFSTDRLIAYLQVLNPETKLKVG